VNFTKCTCKSLSNSPPYHEEGCPQKILYEGTLAFQPIKYMCPRHGETTENFPIFHRDMKHREDFCLHCFIEALDHIGVSRLKAVT